MSRLLGNNGINNKNEIKSFQWRWQDNDGSWVPYDNEMQILMEQLQPKNTVFNYI